jgi:hypothetical protein
MDMAYIGKCRYEIQAQKSSGMEYRHIPAHLDQCL